MPACHNVYEDAALIIEPYIPEDARALIFYAEYLTPEDGK